MNETSIIIVTYNPAAIELSSLIEAIDLNKNNIIIVDNNSSDVSFLERFHCEKFKLVILNSNEGIAKAQNIGISLARKLSSKYVMFFDQDTKIQPNFIQQMRNTYEKLKKTSIDKFIVGPVFFDARYKFEYPQIRLSKFGTRTKINVSEMLSPVNVSCLISSGMFMEADAFNDIGTMNEDFFIDYVDTEWTLRAINKGYKCYVFPELIMEHEIGHDNFKFLFWRVPVHSYNRRFYRIRNAYYLLNLKHIPKLMALREILFSFIHQVLLICFTPNKVENVKVFFRATCKGLLYFIKNIKG